jgi:hypothetical protein
MQRALKDYPLYDPPHKKDESCLPRAKAEENFEYFTRVLEQRVAILRGFLAGFGVDLDFSERALRDLNDWFFTYGGFMIHELIGTSMDQFMDYDPPWTKEWAGYNTVFDVAIFLGEYARRHNSLTYWMMGPGTNGCPNRGSWNFHRPVLVNFPKDDQANTPFQFIYDYSCCMRQNSYRGRQFADALDRERMSVAILEYMSGTMGQRPRKKRKDYG